MTRKLIKNVPKTQKELLNGLIEPFDNTGKPKPVLDGNNRGNDISVRGDSVREIKIGLEDIDNVIPYYFNNVIKPYVIEEGNKVNVPVLYAFPELWKSAQRDGYFKDKDGKILNPVIAYKRDNIEKVRDLVNKLDGNTVQLYKIFEKPWSRKNSYDRFSVLNNRIPVRSFYSVVVPDYIKVTYSVNVYSNYMVDMNRIIEGIMFASDSYWGDPSRFVFNTNIENIPTVSEYANGEERIVKSNFTITINGYLIPDTINRDLATSRKFFSRSQIIFTLETAKFANTGFTGDVNSTIDTPAAIDPNTNPLTNRPTRPNLMANTALSNTTFIDSFNANSTTIFSSTLGIDPSVISYLNTTVPATPLTITSTQVKFNRGFLVAPSGLPATSISNFLFFIDGRVMEPASLISFVDNGDNTSTLTVDINVLGIALGSDLNILAIGKFA